MSKQEELEILEESVLNLEQVVHEENYNEDEEFDESSSSYYDELCKAREELCNFKLKNNL